MISIDGFSQMADIPDSLRHKIVSVQKQTFFNGDESPSMTYTEYFNELGQVNVQTSWNNHFNSMSIKKYYFYDSKGQLNKIQSIHYSKADSSISTETFTYNQQGLLKKNHFGIIKYKYNQDSLLIEKVEKTAKPYDHKTTYSYDSLKRLTKIETFFYSGLDSRRVYEYDSTGKIVKEIKSYFYGDKENPSSQYEHIFEYDKNGLLTIEFQNQTINRGSDKKETRVYKYVYEFHN